MSLPQRVAEKIEVGDCWHWIAGRDKQGYGRVRWQGPMAMAHRVVWEILVGPIPEGLQLDHLCRNKACVNPTHLEVVTYAENNRRSNCGSGGAKHQRDKTHCPQGHEYSEANTYVYRGRRHCRVCNREKARRRRGKQ